MSPSITNPTVFGRLVSLSSATKGVTSNDKGLPGTKGPSRPNWVMGSRLLQRDPPNLDLRIRSLRCFITTFGRFGLFAHRTCRQQPGNPLVAGEKETNRPRAVTCELIRAYHRVPEALGPLPNRFRVRRTPASSLFRGQISLAAQKLFEAGAVGAASNIEVGKFRTHEEHIVSGMFGRERIHYIAPSPERLEAEMAQFIDWFNADMTISSVLLSAIAHLWFVSD